MTHYGAGIQTLGGNRSYQGRTGQDPGFGLLHSKGGPYHLGGWIHEVFGSYYRRVDLSSMCQEYWCQQRQATPTSKVSYPASYSLHLLKARSRYRLTTSHWYLSGKVNYGSQPSTSMAIDLTDKIWCGTDMSEGQRHHYCRCSQSCQSMGARGSGQRWLWGNTSPPHHFRSLS